MDRLLFLSHIFFSSLLYCMMKYVSLNVLKGYSTLHIMGYVNIATFIILLPFALYFGKNLFTRIPKYFGLSFTVIASMVKVYGMGHVPIGNVYILSFVQPLFLILLSFIFLKEYDRSSLSKYLYLLITLAGSFIFIGRAELENNFYIYILMIFYMIFKSLVGIFIKKRSQNDIATLFYMNLFYAIFGILINFKTFNYGNVYHPMVILLAIINLLSLISLIRSYQISKKISLLQNINYTGIVFIMILSYFLFSEKIHIRQLIGGSLIFFSILLSNDIFKKILQFKKGK